MKINSVEYAGQDNEALTFTLAAGTLVGDAVTLTTDGVAGRGSDGDPFYGKVQIVEQDGLGGVERDGICIVPYVTGLTAGFRNLAVNGAGKVKLASSGGRPGWVIGVDATSGLAAIDLG